MRAIQSLTYYVQTDAILMSSTFKIVAVAADYHTRISDCDTLLLVAKPYGNMCDEDISTSNKW